MSSRNLVLLICLTVFLQCSAGHEDMQESTAAMHDQNVGPPSYFRHPYATGWIYAHITLMIVAWAFVLPVAVVLSIARARMQGIAEVTFHAVNAIGLALGLLYNGMTPDLYAHSVHGSLSWIVTGLSIAWSLARCSTLIDQPNLSLSMPRAMRRSSKTSSPELPNYSGIQRNAEDSENSDEYAESDDTLLGMDDVIPSAAATRSESSRVRRWVAQSIRLTRLILDRLLLPLGFAACVSGFVVFSGGFRSLEVYGGLSHWIKGGVFFWCGLLAHGRWIGAFADFGWAWNVKPEGKAKRVPSLEFFESFLIWLYGASNVFLEHLSNWGGEWSATDFEHISITLLFFGGGLLGMLVESDGIRRMLDIGSSSAKSSDDKKALRSSRRKVSLNPIPPLTIMLLGLSMSSHHQQTELGTKLHSQWGLLFCGGAIFRFITLISLHHKPPSYQPSRPITELVASFCLTTGGIIFMMSGRDSIAGLASNKIMAMTAFTATAGLSAVILSWEVVVFAIKGWAQKREPRWMATDESFSA